MLEVGGEKQREAIRQIAQPGDLQQNAEHLRKIARSDDQIAQNETVTKKKIRLTPKP